MIAAVVNAIAVLVGSIIGILFKKGISESIQQAIMKAMGLITLLLAFQNALKTQNTLCVIICLVIGTIIGELIHIDDGLNKCGDVLRTKLLKDKTAKDTGDASGRFTEGFVTTCILFCVGSMTLLGSIQAGINHDYSLIFAKSVMDFVSALVFGAAMGYGVACSSLFVLVFQGLITLAASGLSGILTEMVIAEMSAVGGVVLIGMGINILGLSEKPIKVANMLPAIFLPPAYLALTQFG